MSSTLKIADKNKDFFEQVYEVVKLIPKGKVTSYGAIANYLGSKRGARMVGWAMNNCGKHDSTVPAHRVVNKQGLLTGKIYFSGTESMQSRLEAEDIIIMYDQVQDLDLHFWDPIKELKL